MNKNNLDLVINLRHELHQHPELSNHEIWTKKHLILFLKEHTKLEIIDKGSWFYAIYHAKKSNYNIAFRTEIDALPMDEVINLTYGSICNGISHKCGHDGHMAILTGLALEIDQTKADKNVYFLFQHAEETGDGAKECVAFIKDNNIQEIYAIHNMSKMALNSVNVIDNTAHWASKGMLIHMEGKPSHASEPEKGINPAFAIAKIINEIPVLTTLKDYKEQVLCTVIQVDIGERAFGISASKGNLLLTIRAFNDLDLNKLEQNIINLALLYSKEENLKCNFSFYDEFPETVNNKECNDKIRQVCKLKNIQLVEMKNSFRCSEDFGYYLKQAKGAICFIGNGENYPDIHTYQYDFCDSIIDNAIELFKGIISL